LWGTATFTFCCAIGTAYAELDFPWELEWAYMRREPVSTSAAILVLASVSQAFQGSPQPSLPYTAVHDPQFISATEATFMHPGDRLIGIVSGNVAKAYPAGILSQHGLVEDRLSSGPVGVTW